MLELSILNKEEKNPYENHIYSIKNLVLQRFLF